jgi:hypothetical protein
VLVSQTACLYGYIRLIGFLFSSVLSMSRHLSISSVLEAGYNNHIKIRIYRKASPQEYNCATYIVLHKFVCECKELKLLQ